MGDSMQGKGLKIATHNEEKTISSINGRKLDIHMQKNKINPLSQTIYKSQCKMYSRLHYEIWDYKLPEENIKEILNDLGVGKAFCGYNPKARITNAKIDK